MRKLKRIIKSFLQHLFATGSLEISIYGCTQPVKAFMFFGKVFAGSHGEQSGKGTRDSKKPAYYLKVNIAKPYSFLCIQHWLDVIALENADYYFICDNPILKKQILSHCTFESTDIKFLKSMRKRLRPVASNLYSGSWGNAALAHLTPFYHAKDNGISNHWDIDADDMLFLLGENEILKVFNEVEKHAEKTGLSALSLDVHNSRSHGKHWSLGILYVREGERVSQALESVNDKKWMERFKEYSIEMNLDFCITYLRDEHIIPASSFYVENAMFIHWGRFVLSPIGCGIYYWHNGFLIDQIISGVFGFNDIGDRRMVASHMIDIGLSGSEGPEYWRKHVWCMDQLSPQTKRLWSLPE